MAKKRKKKEEIKLIDVPSTVKMAFRYKYVDFLVKEGNDNLRELYELNLMIEPYVPVTIVKKEMDSLGLDYDKVIKDTKRYGDVYSYLNDARLSLSKATSTKTQNSLKKELKKYSKMLPTIRDSIFILFSIYVKNTILSKQHIPSPHIKSKTENTAPVRYVDDF